jgi:CRISPR-associated protein Csm2
MTNQTSSSPPKKIGTSLSKSPNPQSAATSSGNITEEMLTTIHALKGGLQNYPIRLMVGQAQTFGPYLKNQRLETNQVRKFLDALNRIKVKSTRMSLHNHQPDPQSESSEATKQEERAFAALETDIVLLKPKLAYAAARQRAAQPLSEVMSSAIDNVHSLKDFQRLVQLIESIIAYHKAEGGK